MANKGLKAGDGKCSKEKKNASKGYFMREGCLQMKEDHLGRRVIDRGGCPMHKVSKVGRQKGGDRIPVPWGTERSGRHWVKDLEVPLALYGVRFQKNRSEGESRKKGETDDRRKALGRGEEDTLLGD